MLKNVFKIYLKSNHQRNRKMYLFLDPMRPGAVFGYFVNNPLEMKKNSMKKYE